jgi:hypothetical protein
VVKAVRDNYGVRWRRDVGGRLWWGEIGHSYEDYPGCGLPRAVPCDLSPGAPRLRRPRPVRPHVGPENDRMAVRAAAVECAGRRREQPRRGARLQPAASSRRAPRRRTPAGDPSAAWRPSTSTMVTTGRTSRSWPASAATRSADSPGPPADDGQRPRRPAGDQQAGVPARSWPTSSAAATSNADPTRSTVAPGCCTGRSGETPPSPRPPVPPAGRAAPEPDPRPRSGSPGPGADGRPAPAHAVPLRPGHGLSRS